MIEFADFISMNGTTVHLKCWGDRTLPPLLMLHGHSDCGTTFLPLARRMSDQYWCVAPDMRGYGLSSQARSPLGYHYFEHVADVYELVQRYCGGCCRLLGHSLGGNIALDFAGTFPECVSHVVSIDALPADAATTDGPVRLRRWIIRGTTTPKRPPTYVDVEEMVRRQLGRYPKLDAVDERRRLQAMTCTVDGRVGVSHGTSRPMARPYLRRASDCFPFWQSIRGPLMVVLAGRSELRWLSQEGVSSQYWTNLLPPQAEIVTIQESHLVPQEAPAQVAQLTKTFLARSSPK